ncbi:MAG: glutamine--tRNA ligase/YqeY domain fusion protein [bacterium]
MTETPETVTDASLSDFIRDIVADDRLSNKHGGRVATRFPPEPNGYLHIGHAKSICLNFGIAAESKGVCHLRFDDTNPTKEDVEYVNSIMADVRWLGWDWGQHIYYASDYFEQLYGYAVHLIKAGKAYVCDLTHAELKDSRGTLTEGGKESPYRNRSPEENLDLFKRMRAGEFPDGSRVLRAKIDMSSPNVHMRDPVIYRISHSIHHRTGDKWCIYPMYDFAHCISDAIENITHSICTLEFEIHRPLYDWILDQLPVPSHPRQIEFARLNLSYTVMSKRKLLELVKSGLVTGWDDPRMPTISGLRRRGYTPQSIRRFCGQIGVTKYDGMTDVALLEHCIREELNKTAPRVMAVLDPLKLIIDDYPEGQGEDLDAVNNPEDPAAGIRKVPFCRELYIERDDFREEAPKKFFRLAPGKEVRLRYAYIIKCTGVTKDAAGNVTEVHCSYDPSTRGGNAPEGRKIDGTIHWVSARHSIEAEVRLYDRLFTMEVPDADADFKSSLNPASLSVVRARVEPGLATAASGLRCQFERRGYFCVDPVDSRPGCPVFNRIVPLKDAWTKLAKKGSVK